MDTDTLILLDISVPPNLEQLLGYIGEGSWFAIWWEPAGDEARVADRWNSHDADGYGFLSYIRDRDVSPALAPYNLGNSNESAEHILLIDRRERKAYLAPYDDGMAFLGQLDDPMPEFNRLLGEIYEQGGWMALEQAIKMSLK
jgi:hypothetical protein